jgi:hypothetical protein
MVDRVQRDVDIVSQTYESDPKAVVVDGLTGKTHTIVFAENGGTGNGTKGDPTSLEDAPALAAAKGRNAIIVVEGDGGPITLAGQPVQLENGQALLGGDSKVVLHDAGDSGIQATLHAPGERPTILGADSAANLINMYSGGQNRVTGLDLAGSFDNAIFGLNMSRAVVTDNFIDPPAGNGIFLQNSGAAIPASQLAYIARNTIEDAAGDGIAVKSYLSDTLAHTQAVAIIGNTISDAGRDGIFVMGIFQGLPSASQSVLIASNSIEGAAANGILVLDSFVSVPGAARLDLGIYGNRISGTGAAGIIEIVQGLGLGSFSGNTGIAGNDVTAPGKYGIVLSDTFVDVAGALDATQQVAGNVLDGPGNPGIRDIVIGQDLGSASQAIAITGNSIGSGPVYGIFLIDSLSGISGGALASLSIRGNQIDGASSDGIAIQLAQQGVGPATQSVAIAGNSIGTVGGNGINVVQGMSAIAGNGIADLAIYGNSVASAGGTGILETGLFANLSSATRSVLIARNGIGGAGANGILVFDSFVSAPGAVRLDLGIYGNSISNVGATGIMEVVQGFGLGSFSASTGILGNDVTSPGKYGILLSDTFMSVAGALDTTQQVAGNVIDGPGNRGIRDIVIGQNLGSASQTITITGNSIGSGPVYGIFLIDNLTGVSGAALSNLSIQDNQVDGASSQGIFIQLAQQGAGSATQSVAIASNSIGTVGGNGINVIDTMAAISGSGVASLAIYGNRVASAGGTGVNLVALGAGLAALTQSIAVTGNSVTTGSGGGGIQVVDSLGTIEGPVVAGLSIYGNRIQGGGAGLGVNFGAGSLESLTQTIAVTGNTIDNAAGAGILVANALNAVSDGASLVLLVSGNSVLSPRLTGIYLAQALVAGSASQTLTITANTVTGAGSNGVIDSVAAAGSFTQVGTIDGNLLTGASASGIRVNADGGGTIGISLGLSANSVSGNVGDGFVGLANGAGVTETFTLVSGSGNHFTSNGGNGAYLSNLGGSLTFHINGNDLSGNAGGPVTTVGPVTLTP